MPIVGWRCAVCGATSPIEAALTWRCPNATDTDRHHAPQLVQSHVSWQPTDDTNPFLRFRGALAWDTFAAAAGLDDQQRVALVRELDDRVAAVAGTGSAALRDRDRRSGYVPA